MTGRLKFQIGIGVVGLFFAAIFYFVFVTRPEPSDSRNCRIDGIVPAHTVVLIDQSDPFSRTDTDWTWNLVMDEARALPKHGRLTVFPIETETPGDLVASFGRCSPGSPANANPLYENPGDIRREWERDFEGDLRLTLENLMLQTSAPTSPLMEQIEGIIARYDFSSRNEGRRLIIISDLMQRSSYYSFYESGADWERFAATDPSVPNLRGVEVAVFVARRNSGLSEAELIGFWKKYFEAAGAESFEVLRN